MTGYIQAHKLSLKVLNLYIKTALFLPTIALSLCQSSAAEKRKRFTVGVEPNGHFKLSAKL